MKIKYDKGVTINKGNYESTRIDVGAEMDVNDELSDDTYLKLKLWVENRLHDATQEEK